MSEANQLPDQPGASLRELVAGIDPVDELEAAHRTDALAWIDSGVELHRRIKPATPPKHLVAYCLVLDPAADAVFLVDHRLAELWLPTGGHVDPGEAPAVTAQRELAEELGIEQPFDERWGAEPAMLTVTETTSSAGPEHRHVDVSLWYVFTRSRDGLDEAPIVLDEREFRGGRWWAIDEVPTLVAERRCEPHLGRFVTKHRARRQS